MNAQSFNHHTLHSDKALDEETTLASGSGKDWVELIRIPDGRAAGIASKATPPVAAVAKPSRAKKSGDKDGQPSSLQAPDSTCQMASCFID